jgi:copper homeostasis protein
MSGVVLEVAVRDPRDVPGAAEGGADRLYAVVPGPA